MRRSLIAVLLSGTALALVPAAAAMAGTAALPVAAPAAQVHAVPAVLIHPGEIHALGRFRQPPTTADCEADFSVACYEPTQIQQAYGLPTLYAKGVTGTGETIIIVDSFGSPTIASDLATFDSTFGFPAPPSLTILQPAGPVPPFDPTND